MRENCTSGSVRGAPGNGRSYRESVKEYVQNYFIITVVVKKDVAISKQL
jgi:hypothetical protein